MLVRGLSWKKHLFTENLDRKQRFPSRYRVGRSKEGDVTVSNAPRNALGAAQLVSKLVKLRVVKACVRIAEREHRLAQGGVSVDRRVPAQTNQSHPETSRSHTCRQANQPLD
eukprot:COSAG02_NODE_998_length_15331_cov_38.406119_13_plen_112_part_00